MSCRVGCKEKAQIDETECAPRSEDDDEQKPPAAPYYTEQLRTQDQFWTATINQLCAHIKQLEEEKYRTECSVYSIESSLLPYITYLMIQLGNDKPNLDVNKLLSAKLTMPARVSTGSVALPDLPAVDFHAVQDNDVLYMDIIRAHFQESNRLQRSIDKLYSQACELLKTKGNIEAMFANKPKAVPDKLTVSAKHMNDLLATLTKSKCILEKDIVAEKARAVELARELEKAKKEIADEEQREVELTQALNYAGANIQIAESVNKHGRSANDSEEHFRKKMAALDREYSELQEEAMSLYRQVEEIKCEYVQKQCSDCPLLEEDSNCIAEEASNGCLCEENERKILGTRKP